MHASLPQSHEKHAVLFLTEFYRKWEREFTVLPGLEHQSVCGNPSHRDVPKLKLDPTRFDAMPPFHANALDVWHSMNAIVNSNIQSVADLRLTPIQNFT
jgi:hypothetical protein